MTDKEKKKLLKAFDIPEPDGKEEFAAEFRTRTDEKSVKPILPVILRLSIYGAMAAVIVGILAYMPKKTSKLTDFGSSDIVTDTASTGMVTSPVTTASASTNTTVKTTATAASSSAAVTTAISETAAQTVTTADNITATHEMTQTTTALLTDEELPPVTTVQTGRDMTVMPDVIYEVRDEVLNANSLLMSGATGSAGAGNGTGSSRVDQKIQHLFNISYASAIAKVDKIVYTSIDGVAFSAVNITIKKVYKGSLDADDRITVFLSGGYIPAEIFIERYSFINLPDAEKYSVFDNGGYLKALSQGDTYLFFIQKGGIVFPQGSFMPVSSDGGAVFEQHGSSFVSITDDSFSFDISAPDQFK